MISVSYKFRKVNQNGVTRPGASEKAEIQVSRGKPRRSSCPFVGLVPGLVTRTAGRAWVSRSWRPRSPGASRSPPPGPPTLPGTKYSGDAGGAFRSGAAISPRRTPRWISSPAPGTLGREPPAPAALPAALPAARPPFRGPDSSGRRRGLWALQALFGDSQGFTRAPKSLPPAKSCLRCCKAGSPHARAACVLPPPNPALGQPQRL